LRRKKNASRRQLFALIRQMVATVSSEVCAGVETFPVNAPERVFPSMQARKAEEFQARRSCPSSRDKLCEPRVNLGSDQVHAILWSCRVAYHFSGVAGTPFWRRYSIQCIHTQHSHHAGACIVNGCIHRIMFSSHSRPDVAAQAPGASASHPSAWEYG
jgi:hypothetical protein